MIGNILLKPYNISELQSIKDKLYSNGARYSIKPHGPTPHITIGQFSVDNLAILSDALAELSIFQRFTIQKNEWILTKKYQKANHLMNNDYYWLALLFENNNHLVKIFQDCSEVMDKYNINDNESYINNVKKVKEITDNLTISEIKDTDCIANHLNISNYSRPERVEDSWNFISDNLPSKLEFGTLFVSFQEKGIPIEINEYSLSN